MPPSYNYKLPVSWSVSGIIYIKAKDTNDFLKKVKELRVDDNTLDLPINNQYIDGSFEINDDELVYEMNHIKDKYS